MQRYFGTDGIRGEVGSSSINPEFVLKLGWAIGVVLRRKGRGKVLIGKDTRISGYMLESALEAGLSAAGMHIHLLGPMPTPAVAYLTQTLRARAGIVISASHNPYYDNGIKLFSDQGLKIADEVEEAIEAQLAEPMTTIEAAKLGKASRVVGAPDRYIEFCKSKIDSAASLRGMKIVIDCANGATYHIAPNVFRELGAKTVVLNAKPNGYNINLDCGSTNPALLVDKVLAENADCGVAFDGDGDRLIMVDHTGAIMDGDDLLYVLAKQAKQVGTLKGGVVGTVMSNHGLEQALAALDIPFERASVGDRYVMQALNANQWQLGGEPSGHLLQLNKTTSGDGIIAALLVLNVMLETGQALADLRQGLVKLPQQLVNVPKPASDVCAHAGVQAAVAAAERQLGEHGRVLLRPSGTEPVVRIMLECADQALADKLMATLVAAVAAV